MIVIEKLAEYMATATEHPFGTSLFCYEQPDAPDDCITLLGANPEQRASLTAAPQVDATTQRMTVVTRAKSNASAMRLAVSCTKALNPLDENGEQTNFISTVDADFYVWICSEPVWSKTDQQGRKYFTFDILVTTTKQE